MRKTALHKRALLKVQKKRKSIKQKIVHTILLFESNLIALIKIQINSSRSNVHNCRGIIFSKIRKI